MRKINILFTNVGRRDYMINFVKKIKSVKIFISDTDPLVPCFFIKGIKKFLLPKVKFNQKNYIKKLFLEVKKNKIKKIIPLSDHDLLILSQYKSKFKKIDCDVIISEKEIVKKCMNKKLLYKLCKKQGIETPTSFFSIKNNILFPVIKKKIVGSGSTELDLNIKRKNLNNINFKKFFLQKKIVGTEYGIDIFADSLKNFSCHSIKQKFLMRSGETDRAKVISDKKLSKFAEKLIQVLRPYGNIDCDVIKDKSGRIFLIDANPRFGGGYPATHLSGKNFLKYILTDGKYIPSKKINKIYLSKGISLYKH
jgi:carbamoyl-phosphate synthase large subunit